MRASEARGAAEEGLRGRTRGDRVHDGTRLPKDAASPMKGDGQDDEQWSQLLKSPTSAIVSCTPRRSDFAWQATLARFCFPTGLRIWLPGVQVLMY